MEWFGVVRVTQGQKGNMFTLPVQMSIRTWSLTAMRQIRTDLFDGGAEEARTESLVRNVSDNSCKAFQHLRRDDCGRLGRQDRQEASMNCSHHPTDNDRQRSKCGETILVAEIQRVHVNYMK